MQLYGNRKYDSSHDLEWGDWAGSECLLSGFYQPGFLILFGPKTVKTQVYSVDGNPAGTWVSSRNLTYVKVGHFSSTQTAL